MAKTILLTRRRNDLLEQTLNTSQSTAPAISVIIPAYNAAPFLRQAIDSVLSQTRPGIEIIVVDDGSTDATPEILACYGNLIQTIRQANQGLSAARNTGIAAASGAWFTFLDADDLWLPGFARTMLDAVHSHGTNIGVLACSWQYIDTASNVIGVRAVPTCEEVTLAQLLVGNRFPPMAAIVRRDWVQKVGGFDPEINGVQDWDFWLRLARAGCPIRWISDVLVSYRQVPGSMSRHVEMMRDNGFKVLDKVFESPTPPLDLVSQRELAYGLVKVWAGANFLGIGLTQDGLTEFSEALMTYPALFNDLRTYFAILCAEQPLVWRGTGHELDLQTAEERLRQILALVFEQEPTLAAIYRSHSQQLSHQAIARLANMQGNPRLAFEHALRSLVHRPSGSGFQDLFRFAARTLIARNQE